jgi:hypothetical protein
VDYRVRKQGAASGDGGGETEIDKICGIFEKKPRKTRKFSAYTGFYGLKINEGWVMKKRNKLRIAIKILYIITFVLLMVLNKGSTGSAREPELPIKNRPEGWNGIKWGSPVKALGSERLLIEENTENGDQYIIPTEATTLGMSQINEIRYSFKEDKLIGVDFFCSEHERKELLQYAIEKFGNPQYIGANEDKFAWGDDLVCIYINYNAKKTGVMLRFLLTTYINDRNFFPLSALRDVPNKDILINFGSLKIGDSLTRLNGQEKLIKQDRQLEVSIYEKDNDFKFFESYKIKKFYYFFHRSKLFYIKILFDDNIASNPTEKPLKDYFLELFGTPTYTCANELRYHWYDSSDFGIFLEFEQKWHGIELSYGYFGEFGEK